MGFSEEADGMLPYLGRPGSHLAEVYSLGSECPEREVVDLTAQEKYVRLDRRDNRPECASCNLAEAHLQSNLPPESMECQLRQIFFCS